MKTGRRLVYPLLCGSGILLGTCDGSGSGPVFQAPGAPLVQVSDLTPFTANCGGASAGGMLYENAEVEPYVAVNPLNPSNLAGVWQQDRWSDGGSRGMVSAYSMDSGKTWQRVPLPMSVCAGGNAADGTDYARASDPWISFSPDGTAHAIAIAFNGGTLQTGSTSAVLVSRSPDGGATWDKVQALIVDGASAFNDKESITADPGDANYVYAVWDRLTATDFGPTYFARSTDGGVSWEAAHAIYDPGQDNQTLGNVIAVTSAGTLVDMFIEIDNTSGQNTTAGIRVIRSSDHGASWSAPITVAEDQSVGTTDPETGHPVRASNGLPQIAAGPGNALVITWQDARFNQGKFDGVVLSRSDDDGLSWSAPVQINAVGSTQAFTPSVAVLPDGTVGVTYYDFRNNTSDKNTLPTDLWFVSSDDGVNWSEKHISGPFDLDLAPDADGLFLGDYQALTAVGDSFVPFFVQTNTAGTANRTDVYVLPPQAMPLHSLRRATYAVRPRPVAPPDAAFRNRMREAIHRQLQSTVPGWDRIEAERRERLNPP